MSQMEAAWMFALIGLTIFLLVICIMLFNSTTRQETIIDKQEIIMKELDIMNERGGEAKEDRQTMMKSDNRTITLLEEIKVLLNDSK